MSTKVEWVDAFERLPTKDDADINGNVWVLGYSTYGTPMVQLKAQCLVEPDHQCLVAWAATGLHLTGPLAEREKIRK